jgi:hypothetical protein
MTDSDGKNTYHLKGVRNMRQLLIVLGLILIVGICYAEEPKKTPPESNQQKTSPELEKKIKELIAQFTESDASKWESAQKELINIGAPARPYLEQSMKETKDTNVQNRLDRLLKQIPDPAAKELLLKAFDNFNKAKGYRFSANISGTVTNKTANVEMTSPPSKAESFQKGQDFTYLKIEDKDGLTEVYLKNDRVVAKKPGKEKWQKIKEDDDLMMDLFMVQSFRFNKLRDLFDKTRFGTNDKYKGVVCQIVDLPLKTKDASKIVPESAMNKLRELGEGEITGLQYKIWIGKNDNIIYKIFISLDIEIVQSESTTNILASSDINILDYDKEIDLKIPEEVKGLLE